MITKMDKNDNKYTTIIRIYYHIPEGLFPLKISEVAVLLFWGWSGCVGGRLSPRRSSKSLAYDSSLKILDYLR